MLGELYEQLETGDVIRIIYLPKSGVAPHEHATLQHASAPPGIFLSSMPQQAPVQLTSFSRQIT